MKEKCYVLMVEENYAKLFKRAEFDNNLGIIKTGLRTKTNFFIPDKAVYFPFFKRKTKVVPLWIVDKKTNTALIQKTVKDNTKNIEECISLSAESSEVVNIKLNTMVKNSFWNSFSKRLEISITNILIYMGAGYGVMRFVEYIVMALFGGGN